MKKVRLKLLLTIAVIANIHGQDYNMELLGQLPFDQECSDITRLDYTNHKTRTAAAQEQRGLPLACTY